MRQLNTVQFVKPMTFKMTQCVTWNDRKCRFNLNDVYATRLFVRLATDISSVEPMHFHADSGVFGISVWGNPPLSIPPVIPVSSKSIPSLLRSRLNSVWRDRAKPKSNLANICLKIWQHFKRFYWVLADQIWHCFYGKGNNKISRYTQGGPLPTPCPYICHCKL